MRLSEFCASPRHGRTVDLTVEARFLLLLVRSATDPEALIAARHITESENFDWRRLMRAVVQHGVAPSVRSLLKAAGSWNAPDDFRSALDEHCRAIAFHSLRLVGELIRLDELLIARGVSAVWFKGPVLAVQAYGNATWRHSTDLDVLISPEHVYDVNRLLLEYGYVPSHDVVSREKQRLHEKISNGHSFSNPERNVVVDVHWALVMKNFSFSDDSPIPTAGSELAGRRITTFDTEATLCYLCYHGCKHGWSSFRDILDIAEFIRSNADLKWASLVGARKFPVGSPRMLRLGLALARLATHVPLPREAIDWIERDHVIPALSEAALARCFTLSIPFDWRIHLASMDRWSDRIRHVVGLVWNPSVIEIERMAAPSGRLIAYRILRFKRLIHKYVVTTFAGSRL